MLNCGFDLLPARVARQHMIHGMSFNLLVVGSTGIGKSTLINSLFDFDYGDSPDLDRELTDVSLRVKDFKPDNRTIELKLTIIETKGYYNQQDKSNSFQSIVDYINDKYDEYSRDDSKVLENRYNDAKDNRVHCCIYMIPPTGGGLRTIDLVTMKQLHRKVCLVPVIGKSDTLTKDERLELIEKVRQQISLNGIDIYSPNDYHLPLAIAASNDIIVDGSKRLRVRQYPWGLMNIEMNSDFLKLRDLVRRNMLSLVEATSKEHYENHRVESSAKVKSNKLDLEQARSKLKDYNLGKQKPATPYKRASLFKPVA